MNPLVKSGLLGVACGIVLSLVLFGLLSPTMRFYREHVEMYELIEPALQQRKQALAQQNKEPAPTSSQEPPAAPSKK